MGSGVVRAVNAAPPPPGSRGMLGGDAPELRFSPRQPERQPVPAQLAP